MIATRISAGKKPRASIQLAVRWATGRSKGRLHPINALNYEDNATFNPIPPRLDPQQIFGDLFGTPRPGRGATLRPRRASTRKRSILDYVGRRYQTLAARLGIGRPPEAGAAPDQAARDRDGRWAPGMVPMPMPPGACQAPEKVDTSDYNPRSGLNSDDAGSIVDARTDEAIPKVGKFMTDMLVMALACDLTAVATLQWCDTEAKHTLPVAGPDGPPPLLPARRRLPPGGVRAASAPGTRSSTCTCCSRWRRWTWAATRCSTRAWCFFGNELQDPPSHGKTNMPFLLAGGGGGLRTGRWLKYGGRSHNDLLVSILNLFGDNRQSFGDPELLRPPDRQPGLTVSRRFRRGRWPAATGRSESVSSASP